ncbi:MAG: phosphoheptose isomerase [Nitrospirae bacterium GWC2_42_7]|nr:MAG: phosphoheptose isomerase [Nitrospirae bacterium GWC2_42_7]
MRSDKFIKYTASISEALQKADFDKINILADSILKAWQGNKQVFICGNGGSAANALHIANDLVYGAAKDKEKGIRAIALTGDISVITCIANDVSYEDIFSRQLAVHAQSGDILLALSGSGNSPNIVKAISEAKEIGMRTFAILGFSGGRCLDLADVSIHFQVDDMQISEDMQLIVGHMVMQWLRDQ